MPLKYRSTSVSRCLLAFWIRYLDHFGAQWILLFRIQ